MDEIFRLNLVRPPRKLDQSNSIQLDASGAFSTQLHSALTTETPRASVKLAAQAYVDSEPAVKDLRSLQYHQQFFDIERQVMSAAPNLQGLLASISQAFGTSAAELVLASVYMSDLERIGNSIIALKLVSSEYAPQLDPLGRLQRVIALIGRAAANDTSLDAQGASALALSYPIVLPGWLFPITLVPKNAEYLQPFSSGLGSTQQ
jgi:hypothetical protein